MKLSLFDKEIPESDHEKGEAWHQNSRVYLVTVIAYMGIFLFGYDTGVAGGVVTLPVFMEQFHYTLGEKNKTQIAAIESNVVSVLQLGCFAGAIFASPFTQKFGRVKVMACAALVFVVGAVLQLCSINSLAPMYTGRVISGLGVGCMSMVCPLFVSECAPKNVRGRITGLFQVVVVIGVALSYWIEYGANLHIKGQAQWRLPIGFQIVPCGVMLALLPFVKESPRWLVYAGQEKKAIQNMAWMRKRSETDPRVLDEMAEIVAAISEEKNNSSGSSWKEALLPGNRIRFVIAFFIFFLQNFSGQNTINYYAPTIFEAIGIKGTSVSLLASGIYGIVKVVSTSIFIAVGVDRVGRRWVLGVGGFLMSVFMFAIGAVFLTHIPDPKAASPAPASIAMAALIYLFVIPYCFSWGPTPWVYVAEIFPQRLRPYGLATGASSQWIFNYTIAKVTPTLVLNLPNGKMFFLFGAFNMLSCVFGFLLPETRGLSLEQMDVLFGSVTQEQRDRDIESRAKELYVDAHIIPDKDEEKHEVEHVEKS